MKEQDKVNFERIAKAIRYLQEHFGAQPSLAELAEQVHLSPFHFQRLFTEWAGISPKKFLQYISIGHAKKVLRAQQATLFDAALATGLSGAGRLHDLFVGIEGMTPAEYKHGGRSLHIHYSFANGPFGKVIAASTQKGICHLAFCEDDHDAVQALQAQFPNASFRQQMDAMQQNALSLFSQDWKRPQEVKLHLKGTAFQLKVWETLLKIPMGKLTTYKGIANQVDKPTAYRAVGTAIGQNPVAFLIPCHRVIKSSGLWSGYRWGADRKLAMIGWEAAKNRDKQDSVMDEAGSGI